MNGAQFDLVLHDALVLGQEGSDSIAIAQGAIAACGRFSELSARVGPRTYLIPLGGRVVAPGFIDSHLHFFEAAAVASGTRLPRVRSIEELMLEVRQAAGRAAPGNWLRVFGCDESLLQEGRGPTRQELDEACPKNPLRLRHQTLHASWLNSRAIKLLGLDGSGLSLPAGAKLFRGPEGQIESLVVGLEEWLSGHLPRVTQADLQARARIFSRELAAAGITAFTDATVSNDLDQIRSFADLTGSGVIMQRAGVMLGEDYLDQLPAAADLCGRSGLALAGVKFRGRRACDSYTVSRVRHALQAGARCAFHATEIEETEAALEAIEAAAARVEGAPSGSWRIEHGGVITPEQVERLAAIGAWVVTNPGFIYYRGDKYRAEPGLIPYLYRCRSLARGGVRLAAGTDTPVTPAKPLVAIVAAMARVSASGISLGNEERISLAHAFGLFTTAGAHLAGMRAGSTEVGAAADLVVLPADPRGLAPVELAAMPVDLTIIAGRVVYERGRPAMATGLPTF